MTLLSKSLKHKLQQIKIYVLAVTMSFVGVARGFVPA